MSLPTRISNPAKRGDFVVADIEHVATFLHPLGRQVTYSTVIGTVWNVTREGIAKTVRTPEGFLLELRKITGYRCHYVVSAARIDVPRALEAAKGVETIEAVRDAVRPFLKNEAST